MSKKQNLSSNILLFVLVFITLFVTPGVFGQDTTASYNGLALKPPMGWNSWNTFYCDISEDKIKSVVDSIVSKGLKDAGYEYIVIDDCWQKSRGIDSVVVVDSVNFPSGIKALADYIHSKGLKFGIYSDAGTQTCQGRPGSYNYEKIDAKTYAEWGVDYVKFDWCNTNGLNAQTQYTKMSKALDATGRPIVFSICEWGLSSPWLWANKVGNLWRATQDIQPCWNCTRTWGGMGWTIILDKVSRLSRYSGPGHWNDPDMLEVGNSGLTNAESQAHFSMWCMLAAPLMAGNDVRHMSDFTKNVLTNTELIAIDQDSLGIQGRRIINDDGLEVWLKPLKDSTKAVAFFNRSNNDTLIGVKWNQIGFMEGNATVRDLWQHTDLGVFKDSIQLKVNSHSAIVLKIKGETEEVTDTTFSLDKHEITLLNGNSEYINAIIKPFYFETDAKASNSQMISIKEIGTNQYRITAKQSGTCKFIVSTTDGRLTDTCTITITASELPSPWRLSTIGATISSAFYENDTFNLVSQGRDISENADQFGIIEQSTSGNKSLSCKLISQSNPDKDAKSGIMFRDPAGNDACAFILLAVNAQNQLLFQYRTRSGSYAYTFIVDTVTYPVYLKIDKNNLDFNASISEDGMNWTIVGTRKFKEFSTAYNVGLEALSHEKNVYVSTYFSDVKVTEYSTLTPRIMPNRDMQVTVSPNPVNDNTISLVIDQPTTDNVFHVLIYSNEGKLEYSNRLYQIDNKIEISSTNLRNGIYHLVIKSDKYTGESTFVVNK